MIGFYLVQDRWGWYWKYTAYKEGRVIERNLSDYFPTKQDCLDNARREMGWPDVYHPPENDVYDSRYDHITRPVIVHPT